MKKFVVVALLLVAVVFAANARGGVGGFKKGESLIGLNFGMKGFILPHIGASYEYCVLSDFYSSGRGSLGVGAYLGTTFRTLHSANVRVTLHNQFDKLDVYIGMVNGVNMVYIPALTWKNPASGKEEVLTPGGFAAGYSFDFYLGLRYAFTENWGMNFELAAIPYIGLSMPMLSLGANYKF
ncbi:MAG: hypothetical protein ACTTKZ_04615 [Bacteroides sp.]